MINKTYFINIMAYNFKTNLLYTIFILLILLNKIFKFILQHYFHCCHLFQKHALFLGHQKVFQITQNIL